MKLKNISVAAVAKAIEEDAGQRLPGLRKSLEQAKRGELALCIDDAWIDTTTHTVTVVPACHAYPLS